MANTTTQLLFSRGWEERLLRDLADECIEQANNEEANAAIPEHELMTATEVCKKLAWSLSTLRRNTKARKLAYIKRDGRLKFRRADVERYDKKRYISEE